MDFPGGWVVKNPPANAEDSGSIPGLGRYPGGGNGNPLQHSCLGTPMDRGAWWGTTVHGVTESQSDGGMSIHTTMPHSPRASAHMILGERSVTSPEPLTFRETRGIIAYRTSVPRSRPSGHTSHAAGAQEEHSNDN